MTERELDIAIAERVLGMRVERVTPSWYGREVILFYHPDDPLIVYSYDTNACNAMMYRNGVDNTNGIAPPLPNYSQELELAWSEVKPTIQDTSLLVDIASLDDYSAARRICEVALSERS